MVGQFRPDVDSLVGFIPCGRWGHVGVVLVMALAFAGGWLFSTPVRGGVAGAVLGCLVVACAFGVVAAFESFGDFKAGSVRKDNLDYQISRCDGNLRSALVVQRGVTNADEVNRMIGQIQAQLAYGCGGDVWSPHVSANGIFPTCFVGYDESAGFVGDRRVPDSLWKIVYLGAGWSDGFVRDENGNLLVGFENSWRPADGSICWLYVSGDQEWHWPY